MDRGYFSPCASGSAELDRVVQPQLHPSRFLHRSKQVCGSWWGPMHWRWVQRTQACAFFLLQPRNVGNSSNRKTNMLGKTNTSQFILSSCFPWYFHITALWLLLFCKYGPVCCSESCHLFRATLMSCHHRKKYVCHCVCCFVELHVTVVCVVQRHYVVA